MTVALVTVVYAEPPKYIFKDITPKTLGGYQVLGCKATGIARNGIVSGKAYVTGLNRSVGWTYQNGEYQMIDHDFGPSAIFEVLGCNSKGQLVGYRDTVDGGEQAIMSSNGKFIDMDSGPNKHTGALAINDVGDIVGYGYDANNSNAPKPALLWKSGKYGELEAPGQAGLAYGFARSINSSGTVCGASADPATNFDRASIWRNGVRELLGPSVNSGYGSYLQYVSDDERLVGRASRLGVDGTTWAQEGFVIDENGYRVLSKLGRRHSQANSVSLSGLVSGGAWDQEGTSVVNEVAILYDQSDGYALESLIINKDPRDWEPWGFIFQPGHEQICGTYANEFGNLRAFLASPVPEPKTMGILALGFASALMRKKKIGEIQ